MFDQIQVCALAGPLKDIQRFVFQSHSCVVLAVCLGSLLLLEGEPSPQSKVLSALEQVFIKDHSVLCSVHLSLDPDKSPQSLPLKKIPTA